LISSVGPAEKGIIQYLAVNRNQINEHIATALKVDPKNNLTRLNRLISKGLAVGEKLKWGKQYSLTSKGLAAAVTIPGADVARMLKTYEYLGPEYATFSTMNQILSEVYGEVWVREGPDILFKTINAFIAVSELGVTLDAQYVHSGAPMRDFLTRHYDEKKIRLFAKRLSPYIEKQVDPASAPVAAGLMRAFKQ
jgi:hypothetical protein